MRIRISAVSGNFVHRSRTGTHNLFYSRARAHTFDDGELFPYILPDFHVTTCTPDTLHRNSIHCTYVCTVHDIGNDYSNKYEDYTFLLARPSRVVFFFFVSKHQTRNFSRRGIPRPIVTVNPAFPPSVGSATVDVHTNANRFWHGQKKQK